MGGDEQLGVDGEAEAEELAGGGRAEGKENRLEALRPLLRGPATTLQCFYWPSTPTPPRSFANISQAVQCCALLEKFPRRFYGLLRSARLEMRVLYQNNSVFK